MSPSPARGSGSRPRSAVFPRDTVYAIEPAGKTRVLALTPGGRVRPLARIRGVKTLNGIVFDTVGRFGGRLLVLGLTAGGSGALVTVDCRGRHTSGDTQRAASRGRSR